MRREKLTHNEVTVETSAYPTGSFGAEMPSQLSQTEVRGWILDVHRSSHWPETTLWEGIYPWVKQFHAARSTL